MRHVKGIEMTNVEVSYLKEDLRPAFVLEDVKGAEFSLVKGQHTPGVPVFRVKDVVDFTLFHCGLLPDTRAAKIDRKDF